MPLSSNDIAASLPAYLKSARWFSGKSRSIRRVSLRHEIPLGPSLSLMIVEVHYEDGEPDLFQLPILSSMKSASKGAVIAEARGEAAAEAAGTEEFGRAILDLFAGSSSPLRSSLFTNLDFAAFKAAKPSIRVLSLEQSNTSLVFGDRYILKLYRRLEAGVNPDVEVGRQLTTVGGYKNTPMALGVLELQRGAAPPYTLASLHEFMANEGDAWSIFQRALKEFCRVHSRSPFPASLRAPTLRENEKAHSVPQAFEPSASQAFLLGRRVAEMHQVLAAAQGHPDFAPEEFTPQFAASLAKKLRDHLDLCRSIVKRSLPRAPDDVRVPLLQFLDSKAETERRLAVIDSTPIQAMLTRTHGDLHLGQVLFSRGDFFIIDFEGEPSRPLADRRVKHSPLRDLAGMVRSFDYAINVAKFELPESSSISPDWLSAWYGWVSASFLRGYFTSSENALYLPKSNDQLFLLLDVFLLEKALYELVYEINNRPHWVVVPLSGILSILGTPHDRKAPVPQPE